MLYTFTIFPGSYSYAKGETNNSTLRKVLDFGPQGDDGERVGATMSGRTRAPMSVKKIREAFLGNNGYGAVVPYSVLFKEDGKTVHVPAMEAQMQEVTSEGDPQAAFGNGTSGNGQHNTPETIGQLSQTMHNWLVKRGRRDTTPLFIGVMGKNPAEVIAKMKAAPEADAYVVTSLKFQSTWNLDDPDFKIPAKVDPDLYFFQEVAKLMREDEELKDKHIVLYNIHQVCTRNEDGSKHDIPVDTIVETLRDPLFIGLKDSGQDEVYFSKVGEALTAAELIDNVLHLQGFTISPIGTLLPAHGIVPVDSNLIAKEVKECLQHGLRTRNISLVAASQASLRSFQRNCFGDKYGNGFPYMQAFPAAYLAKIYEEKYGITGIGLPHGQEAMPPELLQRGIEEMAKHNEDHINWLRVSTEGLTTGPESPEAMMQLFRAATILDKVTVFDFETYRNRWINIYGEDFPKETALANWRRAISEETLLASIPGDVHTLYRLAQAPPKPEFGHGTPVNLALGHFNRGTLPNNVIFDLVLEGLTEPDEAHLGYALYILQGLRNDPSIPGDILTLALNTVKTAREKVTGAKNKVEIAEAELDEVLDEAKDQTPMKENFRAALAPLLKQREALVRAALEEPYARYNLNGTSVEEGTTLLTALHNLGWTTLWINKDEKRKSYDFTLNKERVNATGYRADYALQNEEKFLSKVKGSPDEQRAVIVTTSDVQRDALLEIDEIRARWGTKIFFVRVTKGTRAYNQWMSVLGTDADGMPNPFVNFKDMAASATSIVANRELVEALATAN